MKLASDNIINKVLLEKIMKENELKEERYFEIMNKTDSSLQNNLCVGLIACSNSLCVKNQSQLKELIFLLENLGIKVVIPNYLKNISDEILENTNGIFKAHELMKLYQDPDVDLIFDISGGDTGNEILDYLDFEVIAKSKSKVLNNALSPKIDQVQSKETSITIVPATVYSHKLFFGFSDLTTMINAIYSQTKNSSVLFQVANILRDYTKSRLSEFKDLLNHLYSASHLCTANNLFSSTSFTRANQNSTKLFKQSLNQSFSQKFELISPQGRFLRGNNLSGTVVGGNVRCLLKLAGTKYFPNCKDKILFLEARSGKKTQLIAYFSQLRSIGLFSEISGLVLGQFTEYEQIKEQNNAFETSTFSSTSNSTLSKVPDVFSDIVSRFIPNDLPVFKTDEVGHSLNSKALFMGASYIATDHQLILNMNNQGVEDEA